MIAACDAAGVLLMEAFMYRLHPTWEAVREALASGRIGQLKAVQSWFSYFNDDPTNIRNTPASGGGALYDVGCYAVNLSPPRASSTARLPCNPVRGDRANPARPARAEWEASGTSVKWRKGE